MDQTFTGSDGASCTYTISIGYADLPAQAESRSDLTCKVDGALYNVKLNGKHGCQRYENGMVAKSRQQLLPRYHQDGRGEAGEGAGKVPQPSHVWGPVLCDAYGDECR